LGAVDDETMLRCYAEARAVVFIPIDEDYGYITLEAMLAGKPVITATDSGGALEFIDDGVEGFVVRPETQALAGAFNAVMGDVALAERMGMAGHARYEAMDIGWDSVVATLTEGHSPASTEALGSDPAALLRAPSRASITHGAAELKGAALAASEDIEVEALKAMIAPDLPEDPPFSSVAELLTSYDFGTYRTTEPPDIDTLAPYFDTHWRRYLATLKLALEGRTDRVLDVGVFPPFLFQALLMAARPGSRIDGVWEGPEPFAQTVTALREDLADFSMALKPANVECDPLPFPDSTFDLVTGMEILEHFAIDPLFFAAEAARVLRPGGRIILTTPNAVSHRGVRKVLEGESPYSFGVYVPTGGVYGRHNREFTPREVERLCAAAGFTTELLRTADVYDDHIDPETARLLEQRGSFELRGENILYVGRLDAHQVPSLPENLYHGDPRQMSGRLKLLDRNHATGRTKLEVTNNSPILWQASGDDSVSLYLSWYNERGDLVHGGGKALLSSPVRPGESGEVDLILTSGPPDGSQGMIEIELYQSASGRMAKAGRANTLRLPCDETAFMRIVREEL